MSLRNFNPTQPSGIYEGINGKKQIEALTVLLSLHQTEV
jgi:hypothetical protein